MLSLTSGSTATDVPEVAGSTSLNLRRCAGSVGSKRREDRPGGTTAAVVRAQLTDPASRGPALRPQPRGRQRQTQLVRSWANRIGPGRKREQPSGRMAASPTSIHANTTRGSHERVRCRDDRRVSAAPTPSIDLSQHATQALLQHSTAQLRQAKQCRIPDSRTNQWMAGRIAETRPGLSSIAERLSPTIIFSILPNFF